jgi:hypothetical protein
MCGGARLCETRVLRHGREFFSLREGLHNHCLRLRLPAAELAVEAGRRSRTLCQKGAISRSVKISRIVLQAVSQKRYVTRATIKKRSVLVDHSVLSTGPVDALPCKYKKAPPLTAEGKSDPLVSRTSPISEAYLADNPLPNSERMPSGDIADLGV